MSDELRSQYEPDLTPEQVALLPREFQDVDPATITYGAALPDVVAAEAPWRSWLEAAVRHGYVPHQESLQLAQEATFLFVRERARELVSRGLLGDAGGWLSFSKPYRKFAQRLLDEATALDAWRRELGVPDENDASYPPEQTPAAAEGDLLNDRGQEHEVSIRVPSWFASDGFLMTATQLQDPDYVLHGFLPQLLAFFHDNPGTLELSVDGGQWRALADRGDAR